MATFRADWCVSAMGAEGKVSRSILVAVNAECRLLFASELTLIGHMPTVHGLEHSHHSHICWANMTLQSGSILYPEA